MCKQIMCDDKAFLNDPTGWPNWPVCPVKRYVNGESRPQIGVVLDGQGSRVYMANVFSIPITDLTKVKVQVCWYESWDALLADGWVVD